MTHLPTLLRRAVASAAGAALLVMLTAPAALAHDRLKASSPADNAKLERVETIELEFTSRMTMPTILLEGPGGTSVPVGKARAQGAKVSARPEEELAAGRYRIAWRVVSSDGHPIQGELGFTIIAPPATATPGPSTAEPAPAASEAPSSAPPPAAAAPPPSSVAAAPAAGESAGVPGWLWLAAGVLVLGGVAVFFGGRRRTDSGSG
ncbi:copper resistance protein CopC [Nonomuraea sp. NPDC049480]|uniref:copper resistance protein CopC n=1 Tax=Nonomuraea sp. NPDC049480 TaxID=3364353 RepID=UPI0037B43F57